MEIRFNHKMTSFPSFNTIQNVIKILLENVLNKTVPAAIPSTDAEMDAFVNFAHIS